MLVVKFFINIGYIFTLIFLSKSVNYTIIVKCLVFYVIYKKKYGHFQKFLKIIIIQ